MNNPTCSFTGHREIPESEYSNIQLKLEGVITMLIGHGVCDFLAGGALGFDTLAALTVLKLKNDYPHIRLKLILPCRDQAKTWPVTDKKIYSLILEQADEVVYVSEYYYSGCMHKRNRHLVDNSGYCVCYLRKNSGGTKWTVDYALKKDLQVIMMV